MLGFWPFVPALMLLAFRGFGARTRSIPPEASPGHAQSPAGGPKPPAGQAPTRARTFVLRPGTMYRAQLLLDASNASVPNELVLARLQQTVGPWGNASVTGSGRSRVAVGKYGGKQRTVTLPSEVLKVEAYNVKVTVGPATIDSKPPASKPKPKPPGKKDKLPDPLKDLIDAAAPPAPAPSSSKPKPKPKPRPAPPASKPRPPAPSSSAAPASSNRTPALAAAQLYDYVSAVLKAKKGSTLGTKGAPNATVLAAQRDMGGIVADGIYGLATRTRGKQLIGKTFPPRV